MYTSPVFRQRLSNARQTSVRAFVHHQSAAHCRLQFSLCRFFWFWKIQRVALASLVIGEILVEDDAGWLRLPRPEIPIPST